jgi:hypothetical protein
MNQSNMKLITTAFVTFLAIHFLGSPATAAQKRGTDVLHLSTRTAFSAETNSTAQGQASLSRKEQGNAQHQTLDLNLTKLDAGATYLLLSLPLGETNYSYVTSFETDAKGRATVRYRAQSTGQGGGLGSKKQPLPQAMNPVTALSQLAIANTATQVVATADLTTPDKLTYLVKRDLSTSVTEANLRLKANTKKATLKLTVEGLNPTNSYWLALNGTITENTSAAADGDLVIDRSFDDPLEVLGLRSIYLYDAQTNVVVGTVLP